MPNGLQRADISSLGIETHGSKMKQNIDFGPRFHYFWAKIFVD
jgi:hypothetical protein